MSLLTEFSNINSQLLRAQANHSYPDLLLWHQRFLINYQRQFITTDSSGKTWGSLKILLIFKKSRAMDSGQYSGGKGGSLGGKLGIHGLILFDCSFFCNEWHPLTSYHLGCSSSHPQELRLVWHLHHLLFLQCHHHSRLHRETLDLDYNGRFQIRSSNGR